MLPLCQHNNGEKTVGKLHLYTCSQGDALPTIRLPVFLRHLSAQTYLLAITVTEESVFNVKL